MRIAGVGLLGVAMLCGAGPAFAQQSQAPKKTTPPPAPADPESMTCAQILAISLADYIAKLVAVDDSPADARLRGIRRYGTCYDERTDRLAASLRRRGKGPTPAARADFAAFESALKDFTAQALADVPPEPASQKEAYAGLYEKQFRYRFYQEYEPKAVTRAEPVLPVVRSSAPAAPGITTKAAPPPATPLEQARSDADPVTQAKNRFGKSLEALPDDQMHELHRAFSEVIGPHNLSEAMRLAVYRYAIFILEPKSAAPFAAEPF